MNSTFEMWVSKKKLQLKDCQKIKTEVVQHFILSVKSVLFPGFGDEILDCSTYFDLKLTELKQNLTILLNDVVKITKKEIVVHTIVKQFVERLPEIEEMLLMDIEAIDEGDPACEDPQEIILCYPGFYAIFMYRIAHELSLLEVPILPRILSEYAHSKTGIDIHPKAQIGRYFCIDHGTGIVIGETTEIGNYVKIYQGVTLGALSLREGKKLKGHKRHPTILDCVTIYSEASIFGGDTVIGPHVTIGSNAFITSSVTEQKRKE